MKDLNSTILIEIPSYKDEQLIPTVTSALAQAANSDRIHIAICYQSDDMRDYDILKLMKNVRLAHVPLAEARGSCYARKLCQDMLEDEDYILRIDSHMRFIKNWDAEMIRQWQECGDEKAVLSTYPPNFEPEMLEARITDEAFDKPHYGSVLKPLEIRTDEMTTLRHCSIAFRSRVFHDADAEIKRHVWISGGFVFARSQFDRDVPFDPELYFYGDELPIALRAYTHGYNSYAPREMYILHWYERPTRAMPDGEAPAVRAVRESENIRMRTLFGLKGYERRADLGIYGLGTERTLEDFERDSGVSLRNNSITYRALAGYYFNDNIKHGEGSAVRDKIRSEAFIAMRSMKINVIMPCENSNDAEAAMKSARATAARALRLKFIITGTKDTISKIKRRRDTACIEVAENSFYGAYILAGLKNISGEEIIAIIDPGIIFAEPVGAHAWDEDLIYQIISGGNHGDNIITAQHIADRPGKACVNTCYKITGFDGDNPVYNNGSVSAVSRPYLPSLHNDIIAGKAKLFKDISPDINLCRKDFLISQSIRFWTSGIDIYHVPDTYFSAPSGNVTEIGDQRRKPEIIGNILTCTWDDPFKMPAGYKYGAGEVRAPKRWEAEMGVDYSRHKTIE